MNINRLVSILIIIILSSCNPNYNNIVIEGYVKDHSNKRPIQNSKISIAFWVYDSKIQASKRVDSVTYSNSNGYFSVTTPAAEAVDIVISSKNYVTHKESLTLEKSDYKNNFYLLKE